jgi:hypothetical protein
MLASRYPKFNFSVGYWKRYGHLEGISDPREGSKFLKNLVRDRDNLGFVEIQD